MNSEHSKGMRTLQLKPFLVFSQGASSQMMSENHKLLKLRFNSQIQHHLAGLWELHVAILG